MGDNDVDDFMNDQTFVCESVGWVMKEDDNAVLISSTVNVPDTYVGQTFRIPKPAILTRTSIETFLEGQTP